MKLESLARRGVLMVTPTDFWIMLAMKMSARVMRSPMKKVHEERWALRVLSVRVWHSMKLVCVLD